LLVLLAQLFLSRLRRLKRPAPLPWAMVAATVVELIGVAAGESFWRHYLLGLVPMAALGAGLSIGCQRPGWRRSRLLVVSSVIVTAVASPTIAIAHARSSSEAYTTGRWVAESADAGDSIVVPLSHANVVEAAGLRPGYPYSWSLPARTLDPQLRLLARTLNGPAGPTWVVRWDPTGTWGLDPRGTVDEALRTHYRTVATVCGHPVWLHRGDSRSLAAVPAAGSCDAGSP